MKQLFAYRSPNRWSRTLAFIISITFMIVWLPFIRSVFDGDTYEWGISYFGTMIYGAGITPSFLFLVVQLAFYAVLMIGMYRMKNRLIYQVLLAFWWVNIFGNLLFDIVQNGDTEFHGDTLNVHVSLGMIITPLALLAIFLIVQFVRTEANNTLATPIPWAARNSQLLQYFVGSLPIVFVLLFFGEPHGLTDEIGVLIAISHCFYLPAVFRPYVNQSQVIST